jgi:GntR family transcriptional regulator, rspAB operon transcriptional repressor
VIFFGAIKRPAAWLRFDNSPSVFAGFLRMPAKKTRGQPKATRATGSLAQRVYEGLCEQVTRGELRPGQVLSRRKIAARYGTSYIPVIEAMIRLESAGLIDTDSSQMARVHRVTVEGIEDGYVLREALETQSIRTACELATPDEIQELYQLAETLDARISARDTARKNTKDDDGPLQHWKFHRRIAEISRRPVLVRELQRIELWRRFRANWIYVPGMKDPPRLHSILVDAIAAHDADAADRAMRAHARMGLEKELLGYRMQATRELA